MKEIIGSQKRENAKKITNVFSAKAQKIVGDASLKHQQLRKERGDNY